LLICKASLNNSVKVSSKMKKLNLKVSPSHSSQYIRNNLTNQTS
jgi:hypothetical protein